MRINKGELFFDENHIWLSTKEAAFFLGITPNALRIMVCRGKIRSFKLGRNHRFKLSDLNKLLKK